MTDRRFPDFVVIGAQKAGSTFLADRLGQLDGVYVPSLEIPYFESPFFNRSAQRELWRALGAADERDIVGIKRADYLARPEVPANLARVAPGAVLIAVLRPPVGRTVSAVYWYMLHGQLPPVGLNQNLRWILDDYRTGRLTGPALEIIENGLYTAGIDRYRETWDADRLVLIDSRRLDDDDTYQRLAAALALPGDSWPAAMAGSRANPGVYNLHRLRVLRTRSHLVFDWRNESRFTYRKTPARYRPIRSAIALVPKIFDRAFLARTLPNEPEPLAPELRAELEALFAPGLARLANEYGLDLTSAVEVRR